MRCFLAVPLPADARDAAEERIRRLKPALPEGRFVHADHLHLTLHFFEDLADADVPGAEAAARAGAEGFAAFDAVLGGAGVFPDARRPRVLWIGLRAGADRLAALQAAIGRELSARGLPVDDRPFQPHLTLARFREPPRSLDPALARVADLPDTTFRADRVVLFRSVLGPGGAVHTPLADIRLGG